MHDRTVDRTSSGHGVVSDFDLDDLRGLDFGVLAHPAESGTYIEDRDSTEAPVLTLERLLQVVGDDRGPAADRDQAPDPVRRAGRAAARPAAGQARDGRAGARRSTVMSFSTVALRRVRLLAPALPTVQLYRRVPVLRRDGSLPAAADIAGPGVAVLRADPGYVRRVHARGRQVYVWTVDEPADIDLVLALGVDAVITNRPATCWRGCAPLITASAGTAAARRRRGFGRRGPLGRGFRRPGALGPAGAGSSGLPVWWRTTRPSR